MSSNAPPPEPPAKPPADPAPLTPPSLAVRSPETSPGPTVPASPPPVQEEPPEATAAAPPADPSRVACPTCSAMNPATAEICWQCHSRMAGDAVAATAGYSGPALAAQQHRPGPGTPTHSVGEYEDRQARVSPIDYVVPLPAAKRRTPVASILRVLIPIVALVGVGYLGWVLLGGGVRIPDEIGGLRKIENPLANNFLEAIRNAYERQGLDADLAVFGQNEQQPSMYVVVLRGDQLPTPELLLAELSSIQGEAGLGDIVSHTWQGARYQCAEAGGVFQGACLWSQDDVVGAVVSYDRGVQQTFEFAIEAHDAIHGD